MVRNNLIKSNYLDFIEGQFEICFLKKGYIQEVPVKITSQVDATVDFVGSKISPMKKYVLNNDIGKNGRFMIQNCIKLNTLKSLQNTDPKMFGSYYKCMGILTEPNLEKVIYDTFDYLTNPNYLNIAFKDICIRINSQDEDLIKSVEQLNKDIIREIDSTNANYKHEYGLDGIRGRDFNIAIRKKDTDVFINAGTIVIMENGKKKLAIDMGLGNLTLSMCKFGDESTVQSSRMADIFKIDSIEATKLADAISVVSILQIEDIENHPSRHFRKKFRQYNHALQFWKEKLHINDESILEFMNEYIAIEYKTNNFRSKNTWNKKK